MNSKSVIQCPQCGAEAQSGQKFCASCGAALPNLPAPEVAETQPVEQFRPPAAEADIGARTVAEAVPDTPPFGTKAVKDTPPDGYAPDWLPPQPEHGSFMPYQSPVEGELTTGGTSSRLPVLIALIVALLVIAGTIIMVALTISGGGLGASKPIDPAALLDQAAEAMKGVRTFRYQSEVGFYGIQTPGPDLSNTAALSMTVSGNVALPDSYTMNTDSSQLGQFIVIGQEVWHRSQGDPNWQRAAGADVSLGPANPLAIPQYLSFYRQGTPQFISTEKSGKATLHHVRFDVDTEAMALEASDPSVQDLLLSSRVTVDAWIRDDNRLLENITLAVDMGNFSGQGLILRTFFSNYNAEVRIEPPES